MFSGDSFFYDLDSHWVCKLPSYQQKPAWALPALLEEAMNRVNRRSPWTAGWVLCGALSLVMAGCGDDGSPGPKLDSTVDLAVVDMAPADLAGGDQAQADAATALTLSSPSITQGQEISGKFTCDGANVSPALSWTGLPAGTKSLALIMDDPDAPGGTWTHWLIYAIKPTLKGLADNVPQAADVPGVGLQGINDFKKPGYGGPCPPPGPAHNYRFKLHALSVMPALKAGASKAALEAALKGKILAQSTLTAKYLRPK